MKKMIGAALALLSIPALALAADAAPNVQAQLGQLANDVNLMSLGKYAVGMLLGALTSVSAQHFVENFLAGLIPAWAAPARMILPWVLSTVVAKLSIMLGFDPQIAYTSAVAMAGGAQIVNGTSLAADKDHPN